LLKRGHVLGRMLYVKFQVAKLLVFTSVFHLIMRLSLYIKGLRPKTYPVIICIGQDLDHIQGNEILQAWARTRILSIQLEYCMHRTGRGSYPEALNTVRMGQKRDLMERDGIKEVGDRTGTLFRGTEHYSIGIGLD
jgi:hypothetical protein